MKRRVNLYTVPLIIVERLRRIRIVIKILLLIISPIALLYSIIYFGAFQAMFTSMALGHLFPNEFLLYKASGASVFLFIISFLTYKAAIKI